MRDGKPCCFGYSQAQSMQNCRKLPVAKKGMGAVLWSWCYTVVLDYTAALVCELSLASPSKNPSNYAKHLPRLL